MEAENRLKEAEASLKRLEIAVDGTPQEGRNEEELKEEMSQDVRTLKSKYILRTSTNFSTCIYIVYVVP